MTTRRQQRIADLLFEELGIWFSTKLTDELLADAMLTVTAVEVSPDLRNARVFIEHALPQSESGKVLATLHRASGFLRRSLLENLSLRVLPNLFFHVDLSGEHGRRIDSLLSRITADTSQAEGDDGTDTTT